MDLGLLILRLVVGGLMIGHGTQKLFGWFGGHGLRGTARFLESMGYRPGTPMAVIHGTAEAGGGLLLAAGFLTPLGAAAIAGVLFTAIVTVHWSSGVWNENGGLEFPLVLATSGLTSAFVGPGRLSIDSALGIDLAGTAWGLAALALAVVAAAATVGLRRIAAPRSSSGRDAEVSPADSQAA